MRVINWEDFTAPDSPAPQTLALTIGVFDGVHRGHQALIQKIRAVSAGEQRRCIPTVVTFRQHPLSVLNPAGFPGDIFTLEQKVQAFAEMGVEQTVLIDFSGNFSTINGRDFINLLIQSRPVRFIALGQNFRCGFRQDTGAAGIREMASALGIETWIAAPVMDGVLPVSSSRIRKALASGDFAGARRLLGGLRIHQTVDMEKSQRQFQRFETVNNVCTQ
jgi:riboflavin kinase/FMN adenylyltransferase